MLDPRIIGNVARVKPPITGIIRRGIFDFKWMPTQRTSGMWLMTVAMQSQDKGRTQLRLSALMNIKRQSEPCSRSSGDQRIRYEGEMKRFRVEGDFLLRALTNLISTGRSRIHQLEGATQLPGCHHVVKIWLPILFIQASLCVSFFPLQARLFVCDCIERSPS